MALFALAAGVRLLFLAGTVDRSLPFSIFYYGDSRLYREFALALLRGAPFDGGIPFHPPAFAYVLSFVISSVGERPFVLRAVLAVLSATTVPLVYLLGRALFDRGVAITGSLLATFSFALCVAAVSANTETIYLPILVLQALLLVRLGDALEEGRSAKGRIAALAIAGGAVLGLGSLTRAEHMALAVVLPAALVLGWRRVAVPRIAGAWTLALAVAALVVAPWTLHNHRALSKFNAKNVGADLPTFVPVSSYGPLNFALANHEGADGTFKPGSLAATMGEGRLDLSDPKQRAIYRDGYRIGWEYLERHRGAAVLLLARKLSLATDALALGFGLSNWPGGLRGVRRPVDVFVPRFKVWKVVASVLVLAGIWLARARWRRSSILWLLLLHVALVSMAFFGYARFFVHAAPFLFVYQGVALRGVAARLPRPLAKAGAGLGLAIAASLCLELAAATVRPRNFRASGSVDPENGKILQDTTVDIEPAR